MGIAESTAKLLANEAVKRPFSGSLLQLGVQEIRFTKARLLKLSKSRGLQLSERVGENGSAIGGDNDGLLGNKEFFQLLGFSEINTLDVSAYEGCDIIFDLNRNDPPPELAGKYDFILDGGTMEHVFHIPNFLSNVTAMCRVGGRIMHMSPTSNQINHGFYSFSPTLFRDFYTANGFTIRALYLCKYSDNSMRVLDLVEASELASRSMYVGGSIYYTICIVEKTEPRTGISIPQQSSYESTWDESTQTSDGSLKERLTPRLRQLGLKRLYVAGRKVALRLRMRKVR